MPIELFINNEKPIFNDDDDDDEDWILDKPISILILDPADRRVLKVADQRNAVQKKTFTKWMNFYLSKKSRIIVEDLYVDLRDGHLLLTLLEIFTNQTIPRERGKSKFHALRNIEQCLQCLEQDHNIRLVNIRPEELLNGNPKITLGLIWRIILHFQFADITLSSQSTIEKIPSRKSSIDPISSTYRQMLLIWARQQCEHYPGIYIDDFTHSWRNGRAFLVILHRNNPNLIDLKQMYSRSNRENLLEAFNFAQKHYGITQLIDPEDVDTDDPDEKSILLYISHLYKVCPTHLFQQEHEQIRREGELTSEYTKLASEFLICIVENIPPIELNRYSQILQRLRQIDTEYQSLQPTKILEPNIQTLNHAWMKFERMKIELENYQKIQVDLESIEHEIAIESKQFDDFQDIENKLEEISNYSQTISLSNSQIELINEKLNQLNRYVLFEELKLIQLNLNQFEEIFVDLTEKQYPIVKDEFIRLCQQHKEFENNLLCQASRIQNIRNHVRNEYNHHELRSLVNQTSEHVQKLFTASKTYSDKLNLIEQTLNLLNKLTNEIIEFETCLSSQLTLIDDENHIHRHLTDLNSLYNHIEIFEKSINELLNLSQQLNDERLIHTSQQLVLRSKNLIQEILSRKKSIIQILETYRLFKNLYDQEETILNNFEKRIQTLESLSNDIDKLRKTTKIITDLFTELLGRSQSIEHMNDITVKLIEQVKMHDKKLKKFHNLFHELNSQQASTIVLDKIELFDQRYATLVAHMKEYVRLFLKNSKQTIHFPIDSASAIVHLYRSSIASRYNLSLDKSIDQTMTEWNKKTDFIDLSNGKVTADRPHHNSLSSLDGAISLETTYVIPTTKIFSFNDFDNDQSNNKKVRFIIQKSKQYPSLSTIITHENINQTNSKSNDMTQRKNLSFIDAVNSKYLDLSTGLFSSSSSSPSSFVLSSSSPPSLLFSSSISTPDQHRHSHNHFSSTSSSPPHTTTTTTITTTTTNKNLLSTSPLSVNNHPSPVGLDSTTTTTRPTTTVTLKEAIDTNILDACSAYVVDTVEQRNYNLRDAYTRGLINSQNHQIIDRRTSRQYTLGEALKMGILKVGDAQSYNMISKTESLIISSVFDHRANTFIDPNVAIRTKILDPYHGLYLNNLTQETYSIDDAMSKGFVIVEQQQPSSTSHQHHNDKYVISTSLIRETRSYHLLGVRDYVGNKELSVQEAIRSGILDKQNGQYINRKTNEIFSISEAIAHGHIRAQPLPIETTTNHENSASSIIKRGTVKETKTYTLKSAIHPRTRQEIPIRAAIDEGIIDHARGFYVNSVTGENLPISVAIEKGLIFTELIDLHARRFVRTLIIEQVVDPLTNRRLGVTEAIKAGLLNSNITAYYHTVKQKQLTILEAYEQGLIIGRFRDSPPSTFYGDQREQVFYLITGIIDIRTDKVYNLQEGIQQKLFDHKKGVYIHPITNDEINIGEAIKRGFIQVQAVSSQITFNNTDQLLTEKRRAIISQEPYGNSNDSRSKLSIRIESQSHPRTSHEINESEILQREKDVIEIESIQRLPRNKKQFTTREEEIIEHHTTNIVDRDVFIHRNGTNNRGKSNDRQRQQYIEEVVIDDGVNNNRRTKFDIKEDRHTTHREIVIEGDRYVPPPPKDHLIIHDTHREHEVRVVPAARPQPPPAPPRPVHIDDRQREGQRIHHGELIIDDYPHPHPSSSSSTTTQTTITKEYIDITDSHVKPPPIQTQQTTTDYQLDEHQSWTEEEWEQWHCILMIKEQPYRVVWVLNTATGDRLPLQVAYQRNLVDTKQRLFFDEKLNRQSYSFEKAVELGYMGVEPDTASLPIHVDGIDYMIHWVLDSSTKRRIFPRPAVRKQILDAIHGRYKNPYNNSQVSLHEAIYLKFVGATEYNTTNDSINVIIDGQTYTIKWVYDTRNMKKILPREALKQGIIDIQLNEYRKFDTNDIMTILDAIQAGYIRCNDDDTSSDNSVRPPSIVSIDEDELTIATKTATYVITSVIHPLTQKEIKVSEAIDLGILDKDIGSYRDLVTNVQYELAEAINEGLVYATIIETKEDTEMLTSSVQEIVRKFLVKSVCLDSESQEKIGGLEAQAIGILNYAQGVYYDRKHGEKIPLDKAIERKLLEVELLSQKRFEEYDLELITDTITEKRITLYRIHGVRNNVLDRMESGAVAVKNQMIDTEAKTYTDFSTGETMTIQEAINKNLIEAEIIEHVERKPLGLSMQNAIRLGFYVAETGTFRDPATEHYMTLMEAIDRGHIHVNGIAFADSEQGPITLYDAFSLGLINRRDGGKLNPAKVNLYHARLVESKLHRMNVEDAIRCGLLNLRTGLYKHPHSGEQLNLKEAIQRGLIDGQSTIIEHPTSGRFMTLKDALDGIRIDHEGQVIDSHSNKVITTLELAFNHRKLFSQFDVNAGEVFLPSQNESVGFEKAVRKNLLDNNRMKLFDPKTSREYTIQDAIERGLVDQESGLIYDTHSHTQYSIREAIRHGIVAIVGAPLVPIKANHETVAAKITSRKHRRHSLAKSSLHFDYNSAPDSADEDSHGSGSGGWHRIKSRTRAISPASIEGTSDLRRNLRRRTGSSPARTSREDQLKSTWKNDHDDDLFGNRSQRYSSVITTARVEQSSTTNQGGQPTSNFLQKQEQKSNFSTENGGNDLIIEKVTFIIQNLLERTSNIDLIINRKCRHILQYLPTNDGLQILCLQLKKLNMLTFENDHIKEHSSSIVCLQTETCHNAQNYSMHHLKYLQRIEQERQQIKEQIDDIYQWIKQNELFPEKFSLKRSKFDEQIVRFREYQIQLQTRTVSLKSILQSDSFLDDNDKQRLKGFELDFQYLIQQIHQYKEIFKNLNEFFHEHAYLIDTYSKYLRLYTEQIEWNFSNFNEIQENIIDHTKYRQLIRFLIQNENVQDKNEIFEYEKQVETYRNQYEIFIHDLQILIKKRQTIVKQYEYCYKKIYNWLKSTEYLLKQKLTFDLCKQLLIEHTDLPIELLKNLTKEFIEFHRSIENVNLSKSNSELSFYQKQTNDLIENYLHIKQQLIDYKTIFDYIQEYDKSKDIAENSIVQMKDLVDRNETLILPLDLHSIEEMLEKYQKFADQCKILSSTIDDYKTHGLILINKCQDYFDTDLIENDMNTISKSCSEYTEYLFDTIDYLQLHRDELREFYELVNQLQSLLEEKETKSQTIEHDEFEDLSEKITICYQKGEILMENSPNDQSIENVLEKLNRTYENLTIHLSNSSENLHSLIEDTMNNLAELLISSTNDFISCQLRKLNEQILDNTIVENELDKCKYIFEQSIFHDNQFHLFKTHWFILKQSNDLRRENLLRTQIYANQFWSEYNELCQFLQQDNLSMKEFIEKKDLFEQFNHEHTVELITLIADNRNEIQQIEFYRKDLEIKWNDMERFLKIKEDLFDKQDLKLLNEIIQEQKTLIYHTDLEQDRIIQSLDSCSSKLSFLINNFSANTTIKDLESTMSKFRSLLNDIELISYDLEQIKQINIENCSLITNRWKELFRQTNEQYHLLENQLERMKIKDKFFEQIFHELHSIDRQVQQYKTYTNFHLFIERLEKIECDLANENNDELKKFLIDVQQRTLIKGKDLYEYSQSMESYHQISEKCLKYLSECERYLNSLKSISRHFRLFENLLHQIDEHEKFEKQLKIYEEYWKNLNGLSQQLGKMPSISLQTRWQNVFMRSKQRRKDLDKAKNLIQPAVNDIDKIKSEVHRQTLLCQCSKKYDVQQIAEGRYQFGESQCFRLVRILRSSVMVRVGGGWTNLDEYLVRHDPCRGSQIYNRFLLKFISAKGRTNYEIHPNTLNQHDGIAQTMTLFKTRFGHVHRTACQHTSIRENECPKNIDDSPTSGDEISISPRSIRPKPSHIPIPTTMYTPAKSILSRTSSHESIVSELTSISKQQQQQRKPSKLPVLISRYKNQH